MQLNQSVEVKGNTKKMFQESIVLKKKLEMHIWRRNTRIRTNNLFIVKPFKVFTATVSRIEPSLGM
jgi:hypothetical protein